MKRLILLLFCVFITPYCHAATNYDTSPARCSIDDNVFSSCTTTPYTGTTGRRTSDWELMCTTGGTTDANKQIVHGVATCSSTSGTAQTSATTNLAVDCATDTTYAANNKYCWCRMTIPESSLWVMAIAYNNTTTCLANCYYTCGYNFANNSTFRGTMFRTAYATIADRGYLD